VVGKKNPNFPCYIPPDFLQYVSEGLEQAAQQEEPRKAKTKKEIKS